MSMLANVSSRPMILPPRIVVHGKGGVGKTTFGASAPRAVVLPVEEGLGKLEVAHFLRPTTYAEVLEAMVELCRDEHPYRALVVDTIDHVEPLVWAEVCRMKSEEGSKTYQCIEDFGYAKGYVFADALWIDFFRGLDALRRSGLTTIVLCHNESRVIDDPVLGPHERLTPKLHKRANALMYEWADIVAYMDIEKTVREKEGARGRKTKTAQATGRRILYLEDQGGFVAKNRYDLPPRLNVPREKPYDVLRSEVVKALGLGDARKEEVPDAAA